MSGIVRLFHAAPHDTSLKLQIYPLDASGIVRLFHAAPHGTSLKLQICPLDVSRIVRLFHAAPHGKWWWTASLWPWSMVIDTGSPVSLISLATARQQGLLRRLTRCVLRRRSLTGQVIPLRGKAPVTVTAACRPAVRLRLVVTECGPHHTLMGRDWIQALEVLALPSRVQQVNGK